MLIGKVVGTVVSTCKDEKLEGSLLHLVEYVDIKGTPTNNFVVAIDTVGAGMGEIVLIATGSSARLTEKTQGKPVDAIIMAIVDIIEIGGQKLYEK